MVMLRNNLDDSVNESGIFLTDMCREANLRILNGSFVGQKPIGLLYFFA